MGAVSCPAHATSVPLDRPSCSNTSSLVPPRVSAVWRGGAGDVSVAWTHDGRGSARHCTCEVLVNVSVSGGHSVVHRVRASSAATIGAAVQVLQLCGAAPALDQTVGVSVAAVNRAGVSAWSPTVVLQADTLASNISAVPTAFLDGSYVRQCNVGVLARSAHSI